MQDARSKLETVSREAAQMVGNAESPDDIRAEYVLNVILMHGMIANCFDLWFRLKAAKGKLKKARKSLSSLRYVLNRHT